MRKIFTLVFAMLTIQSFSQITTSGMVRYYPFSGNANDSSLNAQHGTVFGATLTSNRKGVPNSAYEFDGISDRIEIPVTGLLLNQYTYAAWALAATVPPIETARLVLSVGTNALANPSGGDQALSAENKSNIATNGWGGMGYNTTSPNQYYTYHGAQIVPNEWVHIALTRSGNVMKFYLNCVCVKVDSSANSTIPKYGNSPTAKIGSRGNNTMFFHGAIDEVRIYDRPLTDLEILMMCRDEEPIGIAENTVQPIEVFPNPASDLVHISFPESTGDLQFTLFDSQGRRLIEESLVHPAQVRIDHLQPGIYIYHLVSDDIRQTGKLVRR